MDTGAYASGRLTAIVIDGEERWSLTARDEDIDPDWRADGGLDYLSAPPP